MENKSVRGVFRGFFTFDERKCHQETTVHVPVVLSKDYSEVKKNLFSPSLWPPVQLRGFSPPLLFLFAMKF